MLKSLSNRIGSKLPGLTNRKLVACCRLPIHMLFTEIELASDFQLSVANSQEFANWQFAAVYQLSFQLLGSKTLSNRIGICLPVTKSPGLTNRQPAAFCWLPIHLLFPITASNGIAFDCQLPVYKKFRVGIWLPFVSCLFFCYALNLLKSNSHLAASCQLPIRQDWRIGIQNMKAAHCLLPNE